MPVNVKQEPRDASVFLPLSRQSAPAPPTISTPYRQHLRPRLPQPAMQPPSYGNPLQNAMMSRGWNGGSRMPVYRPPNMLGGVAGMVPGSGPAGIGRAMPGSVIRQHAPIPQPHPAHSRLPSNCYVRPTHNSGPSLPHLRPRRKPPTPPVHPQASSPSVHVSQPNEAPAGQKPSTSPPDVVASFPRVDGASEKGIFGWTTVDGVNIPFLFRDDKKYLAVRMVEMKLLSKYPSTYPDELKSRPPLMSHYITESEAKLLNEINMDHCAGEYGKQPFVTQDLIVKMSDFEDFYSIVKKHFPPSLLAQLSGNQVQEKKTNGGWVQINNTVVPYVTRGNAKYVPLSVIRYAAGLLTDVRVDGETCIEEECAFLNESCKAAGVDFNFKKTNKLVMLDVVQRLCNNALNVLDLPKEDPFSQAEYQTLLEEDRQEDSGLGSSMSLSTNQMPYPGVPVQSAIPSGRTLQNGPNGPSAAAGGPSTANQAQPNLLSQGGPGVPYWMNQHLGIYPGMQGAFSGGPHVMRGPGRPPLGMHHPTGLPPHMQPQQGQFANQQSNANAPIPGRPPNASVHMPANGTAIQQPKSAEVNNNSYLNAQREQGGRRPSHEAMDLSKDTASPRERKDLSNPPTPSGTPLHRTLSSSSLPQASPPVTRTGSAGSTGQHRATPDGSPQTLLQQQTPVGGVPSAAPPAFTHPNIQLGPDGHPILTSNVPSLSPGHPGWHPMMANQAEYHKMMQLMQLQAMAQQQQQQQQQLQQQLQLLEHQHLQQQRMKQEMVMAKMSQRMLLRPEAPRPPLSMQQMLRGRSLPNGSAAYVMPNGVPVAASKGPTSAPSVQPTQIPKETTARIERKEFQGKTLSCLVKEDGHYALVEALSRVYFHYCTLEEFQFALENVLQVPLVRLTQDEEKSFIAFYNIPTKTLMCNKVIKLSEFKDYIPQLTYMFTDKLSGNNEKSGSKDGVPKDFGIGTSPEDSRTGPKIITEDLGKKISAALKAQFGKRPPSTDPENPDGSESPTPAKQPRVSLEEAVNRLKQFQAEQKGRRKGMRPERRIGSQSPGCDSPTEYSSRSPTLEGCFTEESRITEIPMDVDVAHGEDIEPTQEECVQTAGPSHEGSVQAVDPTKDNIETESPDEMIIQAVEHPEGDNLQPVERTDVGIMHEVGVTHEDTRHTVGSPCEESVEEARHEHVSNMPVVQLAHEVNMQTVEPTCEESMQNVDPTHESVQQVAPTQETDAQPDQPRYEDNSMTVPTLETMHTLEATHEDNVQAREACDPPEGHVPATVVPNIESPCHTLLQATGEHDSKLDCNLGEQQADLTNAETNNDTSYLKAADTQACEANESLVDQTCQEEVEDTGRCLDIHSLPYPEVQETPMDGADDGSCGVNSGGQYLSDGDNATLLDNIGGQSVPTSSVHKYDSVAENENGAHLNSPLSESRILSDSLDIAHEELSREIPDICEPGALDSPLSMSENDVNMAQAPERLDTMTQCLEGRPGPLEESVREAVGLIITDNATGPIPVRLSFTGPSEPNPVEVAPAKDVQVSDNGILMPIIPEGPVVTAKDVQVSDNGILMPIIPEGPVVTDHPNDLPRVVTNNVDETYESKDTSEEVGDLNASWESPSSLSDVAPTQAMAVSVEEDPNASVHSLATTSEELDMAPQTTDQLHLTIHNVDCSGKDEEDDEQAQGLGTFAAAALANVDTVIPKAICGSSVSTVTSDKVMQEIQKGGPLSGQDEHNKETDTDVDKASAENQMQLDKQVQPELFVGFSEITESTSGDALPLVEPSSQTATIEVSEHYPAEDKGTIDTCCLANEEPNTQVAIGGCPVKVPDSQTFEGLGLGAQIHAEPHIPNMDVHVMAEISSSHTDPYETLPQNVSEACEDGSVRRGSLASPTDTKPNIDSEVLNGLPKAITTSSAHDDVPNGADDSRPTVPELSDSRNRTLPEEADDKPASTCAPMDVDVSLEGCQLIQRGMAVSEDEGPSPTKLKTQEGSQYQQTTPDQNQKLAASKVPDALTEEPCLQETASPDYQQINTESGTSTIVQTCTQRDSNESQSLQPEADHSQQMAISEGGYDNEERKVKYARIDLSDGDECTSDFVTDVRQDDSGIDHTQGEAMEVGVPRSPGNEPAEQNVDDNSDRNGMVDKAVKTAVVVCIAATDADATQNKDLECAPICSSDTTTSTVRSDNCGSEVSIFDEQTRLVAGQGDTQDEVSQTGGSGQKIHEHAVPDGINVCASNNTGMISIEDVYKPVIDEQLQHPVVNTPLGVTGEDGIRCNLEGEDMLPIGTEIVQDGDGSMEATDNVDKCLPKTGNQPVSETTCLDGKHSGEYNEYEDIRIQDTTHSADSASKKVIETVDNVVPTNEDLIQAGPSLPVYADNSVDDCKTLLEQESGASKSISTDNTSRSPTPEVPDCVQSDYSKCEDIASEV